MCSAAASDGGACRLQGGANSDAVVITNAASSSSAPLVKDDVDVVFILDRSFGSFFALYSGVLCADEFAIGSKANHSSDRIIYDGQTGIVFYDADGTGKSAQEAIFIMSPNDPNSADHFHVV